jgi:N-acetylglucosaminylphosphatidylinositol deacetylase
MAWIWMVPAAGAVLLWAVCLRRILSSPAPYSLPPSPRFPPPLRGDRRSRNVLLVLAHPDDESMYVSHPLLYFVYGLHAMCSTKFMSSKLPMVI